MTSTLCNDERSLRYRAVICCCLQLQLGNVGGRFKEWYLGAHLGDTSVDFSKPLSSETTRIHNIGQHQSSGTIPRVLISTIEYAYSIFTYIITTGIP